VERPDGDDRLRRAGRGATNRWRCGDAGTGGQPGGCTAETVAGAEAPAVVLSLEVRRARLTRVGGHRPAVMMANGRVLTRHRGRHAIVLGARVDRPVPEEHRDQPELEDTSQRTEPTPSSHSNESRTNT